MDSIEIRGHSLYLDYDKKVEEEQQVKEFWC